jgi:uncharacterized protein (TIGR03792 family)
MVIEWLKFRVPPQHQAEFIRQDEQIWTAQLLGYSGFLGKEVWLDPAAPEEIIMIVRWQTRQQWKSISIEELEITEQQFNSAMNGISYQMLESSEFESKKIVN